MIKEKHNIIGNNLRPLNKIAEKIFFKIISGVNQDKVKTIGNTNKTFMPVVIEEISSLIYGKVYSIGHYYIQNGDRMSDPEMTFLVNETNNRVYPISFEQHGTLARYEEGIILNGNGEFEGIYKKTQKDHAVFASQWMKNIKDQQNI